MPANLYERYDVPYEDPNLLYEAFDSWTDPVKTGQLHIGKFEPGDPQYIIENEIIRYGQISENRTRYNVVSVDGNLDSWTEFDKDDLVRRDASVNQYLDLPELKSPGEVRQRALEELKSASRVNSPGGDVVWQPWFTQKDSIYWVDESGQKYTATIEGLAVSFSQGPNPFQRVRIDTGNVIFCETDVEPGTYFARDLFERSQSNLGDAVVGGTWVTY